LIRWRRCLFPESHAATVEKWREDFVIKNTGRGAEKNGTLEFMTPNLQEVLFKLTFTNLGIFKLSSVNVESGSEGIRRLKAELYCEDMQFEYAGMK
jgi:hypothetical protein